MENIQYDKIFDRVGDFIIERPQIVVVYPYLNNFTVSSPMPSRIEKLEHEVRKLRNR